MAAPGPDPREAAVAEYRSKLVQHTELDARLRTLREEVKVARKEFDKTEDDLKALQSVGQVIGEVLRQLDPERCAWGDCERTGPGGLGLASSPACTRGGGDGVGSAPRLRWCWPGLAVPGGCTDTVGAADQLPPCAAWHEGGAPIPC